MPEGDTGHLEGQGMLSSPLGEPAPFFKVGLWGTQSLQAKCSPSCTHLECWPWGCPLHTPPHTKVWAGEEEAPGSGELTAVGGTPQPGTGPWTSACSYPGT